MASVIPAFVGMLTLALLPKDGLLWVRWGIFLMTVTGDLPGLRKFLNSVYGVPCGAC